MTLQERYDELHAGLKDREKIFRHIGIKNPMGGYYVEPMMDPDFDYEIPMLRVFYQPPRVRESDWLSSKRADGWEAYKPIGTPEAVKPATRKGRGR